MLELVKIQLFVPTLLYYFNQIAMIFLVCYGLDLFLHFFDLNRQNDGHLFLDFFFLLVGKLASYFFEDVAAHVFFRVD